MSAGAGARGSAGALIAEIHACQGCGACLLTCPEHAIRPRAAATASAATPSLAPAPAAATLVVHPDRCTGCGECVEVCPVDAIAIVLAELAPKEEPTA